MKERFRIIIIEGDNQTHPYEFKSYEEALIFLQSRARVTDAVGDKLGIPDTVPEGSLPEDDVDSKKKELYLLTN